MRKITLAILTIIIIISSCSQKKTVVKNSVQNNSIFENKTPNLNKIISEKEKQIKTYKASNTIINDLIHTKLELSFDYINKQVNGIANISFKPHYYKTNSLTLDAQSFIIHSISIKKSGKNIPLIYKYKDSKIHIQLNKTYSKNETYTIRIEYTAKPEEVKNSKSWAIRENKGLYFINTQSDNPQIWTQGETQSSSAWFPTIDSPNQKMTQEIYLTVKKDFKTLSNGKLVNSLLNDDGTRTDYWRQEKPHAPYLAMIAIGNFTIIKDSWRDLPLNVYVEKKDKEKAKELFKNTGKMIEFFSRKLNYDFPWDKYSQIVVKNFVSGAMENTGAVVFGDFVLNFNNEEKRRSFETVVAHELSHHWFGDLITCESWANLPLNESFATYFEYIWLEHQYGRYVADIHISEEFKSYSFEHLFKDENLIRFHNKHRDNMFDAHSYQKGGMILHMLRYTVGDDAFWDALELYLKKNEYKAVEIHHLRLAFEEVTGQDLNWFFNQWFLNKGIPELNINYNYDSATQKANIKIEQIQDLKKVPLYKIPAYVDFYFDDKTIRKKVVIDEQTENFEFYFNKKPLAINFDANNSILCKKTENYTKEEYVAILDKAPLYIDKNEALNNLKTFSNKYLFKVCTKLTKHEYWKFRYKALYKLSRFEPEELTLIEKEMYKNILKDLSVNDDNEWVRKLALKKLKAN